MQSRVWNFCKVVIHIIKDNLGTYNLCHISLCHGTWVLLDLSECQIREALNIPFWMVPHWIESSRDILKNMLKSKVCRNWSMMLWLNWDSCQPSSEIMSLTLVMDPSLEIRTIGVVGEEAIGTPLYHGSNHRLVLASFSILWKMLLCKSSYIHNFSPYSWAIIWNFNHLKLLVFEHIGMNPSSPKAKGLGLNNVP